MIVTVTASPSLDLTYRLADGDSLSAAGIEVHRADSAGLEASGKGVNVSRALTLAGIANTAVLFAGGSTGEQLLELLSADGVRHAVVPQAGATKVNTTVLTASGVTTKLNAPGGEPAGAEVDDLIAAVDRELPTPGGADDWLLICGSVPPGAAAELLVARLIERAHEHGWRVGVDSSGAGLSAALAAGADLLAPNADELAGLLGPDVNPDADLFAAASALAADRGCELLVSLGVDGALWTDGHRALHACGPAVVPVNSAGAGDALLAGWFATREPDRLERRLATAVAWGTAACLAPTTVATGGAPAIDAVLVHDLLGAR